MNLTIRLKGWLSENCGIAATATDADFQKAALDALASGKLAAAKYAELSAPEKNDDIRSMLSGLVKEAVAGLQLASAAPAAPVAPEVKEPDLDALAEKIAAKMAPTKGLLDGVNPAQALAPVDSATSKLINSSRERIRVKSPVEGYSSSKSALVHNKGALKGQAAKYMGRELDSASQADLAVAGAYWKWCVNQQIPTGTPLPAGVRMTEHDKHLVEYALHEMAWTGELKGGAIEVNARKLSEFEIKALLDDSTSGGLEAAPIVFDDRVITTPLLTGELFPLVDVTPLSRGRRVEGWSISNPSFTSNVAEGTGIPTFDTSSFIAAFDNTIYTAVGAMELGYDFEDDTPNNVGAIVTDLYGRKALEWLDEQIAWGDGTNEPQGIFNAGMTDIGNPAAGAGGAAQVDDYEALLFGLAKQYRPRSQAANCVYVGSDVTYKRARGIQVGASDERRVFGMDEESYSILGHSFRVPTCPSITATTYNANCAFVNMSYYRLYRRLGLTMRIETGGKELALKNLMLMVLRMRWGGKMTLTSAGVFSDSWDD